MFDLTKSKLDKRLINPYSLLLASVKWVANSPKKAFASTVKFLQIGSVVSKDFAIAVTSSIIAVKFLKSDLI